MLTKRTILSFVITTIIYWLLISLIDYSGTKISYWQDLKNNALHALFFGILVTILNWVLNKYFVKDKT